MSIFDRKRPLKTLKRYFGRFFQKKHSENIEFINTTIPPVVVPDDLGELADTPGNGEPGDTVPDGDIPYAIADADGDTVVNTEESDDEDKIRFDTGGSERFRMEANDTNGGALYIKEGSGTTAPSTPDSGEGVFYEKNDGKIYFKNDGGTEYDLTSGAGGGMSSFDITGDSGSAQTVTDGNTVDIEGGTGINTVAGATDKVTINCDLEGTELKSTGESGGSKFLREDGDNTCSWQTVDIGMESFTLTGDSGSNQTVENGNTVDIEGGTGINTVVGATDKVTVNCDLEGTELKSTGETGGSKYLREDGDGTCSWQSVPASGAPTDAQYVTLATDGDLDNERVLTAGDRITLTDGGAGSTATIAAAQQRVIISHTWAIGGEVKVASGDTDFIIPMTVRDRYTSSGYNTTVKIVSVIASINSGTNVTWKLQKNGSDLTGYGTSGSPLTATATPATTESTQTLADKDELAPVVVAISSTPKNMSITAFLEITAA